MVRGLSIILGFGLIALCIVGLSSPVDGNWLVWLDGVAGVVALIVGAATGPGANGATKASGQAFVSLGLFALWIIGMATAMPAWLNWWTFAFACAFGLLAIYGGTRGRAVGPATGVRGTTEDERRERFRRSA